jgi:hypothetical protein
VGSSRQGASELRDDDELLELQAMLQRTFGFDALRSPKCDVLMRVIATITESLAVKKILSHLGMRTEPVPRARAERMPTKS